MYSGTSNANTKLWRERGRIARKDSEIVVENEEDRWHRVICKPITRSSLREEIKGETNRPTGTGTRFQSQ